MFFSVRRMSLMKKVERKSQLTSMIIGEYDKYV